MTWIASNSSNARKSPFPTGRATSQHKGAIRKFLLWILVPFIATTGIVVYLNIDESSCVENKAVRKAPKRKRIKEVSPKKTVEKITARKTKTNSPSITKVKPEFKKRPGAMQLPDGRELTFPVPKEGGFRMVHSHGKIYKCDHLGNFEDVTPKPIFDNAFEENLISMSADKGTFIPGLLMGLDKKTVLEMLNKPVIINPDDSDDVVTKKRSVAETKQLALKYMEETGGSFDDFVMDMRSLASEERSIRGQAMREIVGLLCNGRVADAVAYRNQLNADLSNNGFSPVKLPSRIEELLVEPESKTTTNNGAYK